jgi:hypothetical protein
MSLAMSWFDSVLLMLIDWDKTPIVIKYLFNNKKTISIFG